MCFLPLFFAFILIDADLYICSSAVPKLILNEMNVPGLTREHVASHLQVKEIRFHYLSNHFFVSIMVQLKKCCSLHALLTLTFENEYI
jgi:hypothetical protein